MARYKRYGDMLVVEPQPKTVEEVAIGLCGTVLLGRREAQRRLFGEELDDRLRGRLMGRRPRDLEGRNRRRVEQQNRRRSG